MSSLELQKQKHHCSKCEMWFLGIINLTATLILLLIIFLTILSQSGLNHVSGSWTALAVDLKNGIFYRPLFSEIIGSGGTRFFPLFFILHSILLHIINSPIISGHIINLLSGILLFSGLFYLLKIFGTKPLIGLSMLLLLLSTNTVLNGLQNIRGDILPVAFTLWGIAIYFSKLKQKRKMIITSFLFILAFATKVTAVNGFLALAIYLYFNDQKAEFSSLLKFVLSGYGIVLLAIQLFASGNFFSEFFSTSPGGMSAYSIIKTPATLARVLFLSDPVLLLILVVTFILIIFKNVNIKKSLPVLFLLTSGIITVSIFSSPGINFNHFIDVATASVFIIGYSFQKFNADEKRKGIIVYFFVIILIISFDASKLKKEWDFYRHQGKRYKPRNIELIRSVKGEILSENPYYSILTEKHVYVLDPFMLRLIQRKDKHVQGTFLKKIRNREFSLIVLKQKAEKSLWYKKMHFGNEIIEEIYKKYQLQEHSYQCFIYSPKNE